MRIRWVLLNLAGQRLGEPIVAVTRQEAYDLGCALHGAACHQAQSLLSWEAAEEDRSIAERMRRIKYGEDDAA